MLLCHPLPVMIADVHWVRIDMEKVQPRSTHTQRPQHSPLATIATGVQHMLSIAVEWTEDELEPLIFSIIICPLTLEESVLGLGPFAVCLVHPTSLCCVVIALGQKLVRA